MTSPNGSDRGPDWGPPLTPEEAAQFAGAAEALADLPETDDDTGDGDGGAGGTQASRLVALAQQKFRLLAGTDSRLYAVPKTGPAIASSFASKHGLEDQLAVSYFTAFNQAPGGGGLNDALTVLKGLALQTNPEPVGLRVATTPDGATVLDLGSANGHAVVIDPTGWRLVERSPVLFRRSALTSPLTEPETGGNLDALRALINVDDSGWRLAVGWLIAALIPDIPHPILCITGEQGTAKSTAAMLLVSTIDPSPAPLRSQPRDLRSWAVTASASWTFVLDNVSDIPAWFSDTLCKACTGDGIIERTLHSDDDVTVLSFRRCVALTSIDPGHLAGDLTERLVPIELARIPKNKRRTEADVLKAAADAHPKSLGALLDLLAQVLAVLPAVRLDELPRMADFARILAALDHVTGWTTLADYNTAAAEGTTTVLESSPLAAAVIDLAGKGPWSGTAADLHATVTPDPRPRAWPSNARAISGALRRIAPALAANGITVDFNKTSSGTRTITISGRRCLEERRTHILRLCAVDHR